MSENKKETLDYTVNVGVLPGAGFVIDLDANEKERAALAIEADILEIKSLKAELVFRRWRKDGVGLKGRIFAKIVQECVVTLEPLNSEFTEEVERTFLPEGSRLAKPRLNEDGEMVLDLEGADIPDLFIGNTLNVWEIILEHLQLGLDPFPRAEGVQFTDHIEDDGSDDKKASPFAALSALNSTEKNDK